MKASSGFFSYLNKLNWIDLVFLLHFVKLTQAAGRHNVIGFYYELQRKKKPNCSAGCFDINSSLIQHAENALFIAEFLILFNYIFILLQETNELRDFRIYVTYIVLGLSQNNSQYLMELYVLELYYPD